MRIAILGWGSLIPELRGLPVEGDWQRGGPVVPIEFSRISQAGDRAGCLTLVVDPINGVPVTTQFIQSSRRILTEAVDDLVIREGTSKNRIGVVDLQAQTISSWALAQHPSACQVIRNWAINNGFDAVIWTALTSNFEQVLKQPFSVAAALTYCQGLTGGTRRNALEYIRTAPGSTQTPFREEIARLFLQ